METTGRMPVPKTIDVTLDGEVLAPPSLWSRLARLWQLLPRGSVPVLVVGVLLMAALAVLLLGALLVAVPILLVLAVVSTLLRGRRHPIR